MTYNQKNSQILEIMQFCIVEVVEIDLTFFKAPNFKDALLGK